VRRSKKKAPAAAQAGKPRNAGTRPKSREQRKQRTGGIKRSRGLGPEIRAKSGWTGSDNDPLPKGMFEDADAADAAAHPKRQRL